jgi:hypothetical protein
MNNITDARKALSRLARVAWRAVALALSSLGVPFVVLSGVH